jgi:hypothetical protein
VPPDMVDDDIGCLPLSHNSPLFPENISPELRKGQRKPSANLVRLSLIKVHL